MPPGCWNNPLIVPLNRKRARRGGCGGEAVHRVQLGKEREGRKEDKERERESR